MLRAVWMASSHVNVSPVGHGESRVDSFQSCRLTLTHIGHVESRVDGLKPCQLSLTHVGHGESRVDAVWREDEFRGALFQHRVHPQRELRAGGRQTTDQVPLSATEAWLLTSPSSSSSSSAATSSTTSAAS